MNRLIFLLAILMICFALEGVVELTDSNFKELLQSQPKLWFVVFSASWCGQCTDLKPQLEKVAPLLAELGVTVGHVGQHNQDLIIDFVLDPKTHLLSYPKLMVFKGGKKMSDVPIWLRSAPQILDWFKDTYNLMASNQL